MAKDCMGGIRDPDWLDLPPISSLGMGVHSLTNLPANSTIKKKAAIIIMAVEVKYFLCYGIMCFFPPLVIIKLCLKADSCLDTDVCFHYLKKANFN